MFRLYLGSDIKKICVENKMSELRLAIGEAERLRAKYPGRVPVFVFRATGSRDIPDLVKHKFLVPTTMTLGGFTYTIRKELHLAPGSRKGIISFS
jgi:SpoVK/Ycf46/Vps4 family AAA+-type ATPase